MPQLLFQKYIDREYEEKQLALAEISDRVVRIDLPSIQSDEEFISQAVQQSKSYAQLILELFDYIESSKPSENGGSNETRENNDRLLAIISSSAKKQRPRQETSVREGLSGASSTDPRYLEQKVEYLNNQIMKARKQLDSKSIEIENLQAENAKFADKVEFLNENIAQLIEQSKSQLAESRSGAKTSEEENKELLEINFQLTDKYKALEVELARKRKEMIELLDKVDPEYVEKLEAENEQLREQNEFSEKLEDIDKYKEIISEKERQLANLQKQLETLSANERGTPEFHSKHKELARVINRVIKEINDLMLKHEIAEGKVKEIPQDSSVHEEDSDFLINRINSKLIDICDSLRLISDSLIVQKQQQLQQQTTIPSSSTKDAPTTFRSPDRTRISASETPSQTFSHTPSKSSLFSKVLESAQYLRDQLEEGSDREGLVSRSRAIFQDLLILFHDRQAEPPLTNRRLGDTSQDYGNTYHPISSHNATRSPARILVRDSFLRAQEEISGQLRHSVTNIQTSNHNELTQQLQIQIDRGNAFSEKYETLQKAFHTVSLVINDELMRCLYSLDDVLSIATENTVILKLKRDLSTLKAQIQGLFAKQGHYYTPQLESVEVQREFDRQRAAWETHTARQKESFSAEIQKLEEALRREENGHRREKELHQQLAMRSEEEIRLLEQERERLTLERERLAQNLREDKANWDELARSLQEGLEIEKQSKDAMENQLRELETIIEDRENTVLEYSRSITEWQNKFGAAERDILDLEKERDALRREKEMMREQLSANEVTLKEFVKRVELLEQRANQLEQERDELERTVNEKERIYEVDRENITDDLRQVQEEYRKYTEKTQTNSIELKESYERLVEDYSRQLEQQRSNYESFRLEKESELRAKRDEIRELALKCQTNDELLRVQETTLKRREDKLNQLTDERNALSEKASTLERQMREMTSVKDKNKKYFDLLTNANTDLSNLKSEFQLLMHEKKDILQRSDLLERENADLKGELDRLRDNLSRNTQKLNECVSESKSLRIQLETEQQTLIRKEKELKFHNESTLVQNRATITFKDELIQRLKDDVKSLSSEYENLRVQYQRISDRNEEMTSEIHSLRSLAKDKDTTFKEMEELDKFNDGLLHEMKRMRNELKKKDDEISTTKRQYKHELQMSQRKLRDVSSRVHKDEAERIDPTKSTLKRSAQKDRGTDLY